MFRALDRRTGKVQWATPVRPDEAQYFFHGDPLIAGDLIVAGADAPRASIHAFDRATGQERWKREAGRGANGPMAGDGTRAYVSTLDGQLLALDVATGEVRWTRALKVPGFEGPAAARRRVFAGTVDGSLYALNAETGRDEWRISLGAPVTTSVAASDDDVYVGTADGHLYRIDARDGTVLGSRQLDATLKPGNMPVIAGDSVFVLLTDEGADRRALVALDRTLKTIRWRLSAARTWSTSRTFLWNNSVVLGTGAGEVIAYCLADGNPAWSRTLAGTIRAIGGAGDVLYVGTSNGHLYALSPPAACGAK